MASPRHHPGPRRRRRLLVAAAALALLSGSAYMTSILQGRAALPGTAGTAGASVVAPGSLAPAPGDPAAPGAHPPAGPGTGAAADRPAGPHGPAAGHAGAGDAPGGPEGQDAPARGAGGGQDAVAGGAPPFDLLIRGGRVVDGSGRPAFRADVGVRGDRIAAVGDLAGARARIVLDATGRVVAPGFINAHSHTYEYAATHPDADADLLQGITTVIGGVDGRSPLPLAAFFARLEAQGIGNNHALFAGHGSLRAAVMGQARRAPRPQELQQMARLLRRAMADGALGLSTGLEYVPGRYARTDELIALAREIAPYGGIYSTHMRSEGDAVAEALAEALAIGRAAGVPVDISHFKVVYRRNWPRQEELVAAIAAARRQGQVVVADVYPYLSPDYASALPLQDAWRRYPAGDLLIRRSRVPGVAGRTLAEVAAAQGVAPAEAARRLLAADPATTVTALVVSEENLRALLRQPFTIISSDGGARSPAAARRDPRLHPRVYGAYPRVLARYVRDQGVLSLEEAVHKMTGQPAAFFGLRDRGLVRAGMYADLVVFDPAAIRDAADWVHPAVSPEGITAVVVNGRLAVEDGRRVPGVRAGRVLRGGRDALVGRAAPAGGDGGR